MSFVITRICASEGVPIFWTGGFTASKEPKRTKKPGLAKSFESASEAYARALTEPRLQGWRVRRTDG